LASECQRTNTSGRRLEKLEAGSTAGWTEAPVTIIWPGPDEPEECARVFTDIPGAAPSAMYSWFGNGPVYLIQRVK
jgi:hypothetical protein